MLVVTHKIVSKAEGRLVDLATIQPSAFASDYAERYGKDARQVEVVLRESNRIVRMGHGVMICETRHGFICANAGVDASNVPGDHVVCLLPVDPDRSARQIRDGLTARFGVEPAVIISDSFGRRRTYLLYLIAAAVLVYLYGTTRNAMALLALGPFVAFFGTGYFSGFGAVTAEIYPTTIRATAQGFTYNIGRVASAIAPFAVGTIAQTQGFGVALSMASAAFLLAAVMWIWIPETAGRELA